VPRPTKLPKLRSCVYFYEYNPSNARENHQILTGSSDRTIRLYNPLKSQSGVPSSGLIQSYSAHGYEVLDIAVTDDNARFASVGGDKQVFLWDVATARTLRRWAGHFGRVNCVGFGGEGGSVVVSGSFDATVRLWDCKSQSTKPIQVLEEAKDSVSGLCVVGHEIVTGSVDGRMRVYDLRMGMVVVDVVGREIHSSFTHGRSGGADIWCMQSPSHPSNKHVTATQSSFRRSTVRSGLWIRAMDSCCRATKAIVIRTTESGLCWEWRTRW